jgi:hypothetical protein
MQDNDRTGLPDAEAARTRVMVPRVRRTHRQHYDFGGAGVRMAEDLEQEADRLAARAA